MVQRYSAWVSADTITLIIGIEPAGDLGDHAPVEFPAPR